MPTTHPEFERIHGFHDGSLPPAERAPIAAHLEACAACRATLASIPRIVSRVEAETDLEVPAGAWERIMERRAAGERIIPPALVLAAQDDAGDEDVSIGNTPAGAPAPPISIQPATASSRVARRTRQRSGGWTPGLRRAAVLVLGLAGVASATVAVPLIRRWLPGDDAREETRTVAPLAHPAPDSTPAGPPPPVAGVSIAPLHGAATVDVDAPDPALRIRIRLVDTPEVEARAVGSGAGEAVFHPRPGRLRVQNAGAGELELLLPRSASRITVRVDGEPYLVSEGGQIRVLGPAAESADSEVVLRVRG